MSLLNADAVATIGSNSDSKSISGVGYGFGLRGMIDKKMFYQVGYDINKYNENDIGSGVIMKPSSTALSLGVGYKF